MCNTPTPDRFPRAWSLRNGIADQIDTAIPLCRSGGIEQRGFQGTILDRTAIAQTRVSKAEFDDQNVGPMQRVTRLFYQHRFFDLSGFLGIQVNRSP